MGDALVSIHVQSGLRECDEREPGEEGFRGFCTVFAAASDGSRMVGQLDPAEVRKMALNFIESAEAAVQDAVVMNLMVSKMDAPVEVAAGFVTEMRNEHLRVSPDPLGDDEVPL
jgi:hypothetical protein